MEKKTQCALRLSETNMAKGIAILCMMLHHCFMAESRFSGFEIVFSPFTKGQLMKLAVFGKICIPVFVYLSAYGITVSLMKIQGSYVQKSARLTLRRLIKLYAGYWFAYLVCFLVSSQISPERLGALHGEGNFILNLCIDLLGFGTMNNKRTMLGTFWYVSLAVMEILLIPILFRLMKEIHPILLCAAVMALSRITRLYAYNAANYHYLLTVTVGIWSARDNLWGRVRALGKRDDEEKLSGIAESLKALLALALLPAACKIFYAGFRKADQDITMTICALIIVYGVVVLWSRLPGIRKMLEILGLYSMNIYYVHNFYRLNWLHQWVFSWRYWWAVCLALLAVSFVTSVVMEGAKKLLGYSQGVDWLASRFQ